MNDTPNNHHATLSPFWCGVAALFLAPVGAILFVLMGLLMICAWPFLPFLVYAQKAEEVCKANTTEPTE